MAVVPVEEGAGTPPGRESVGFPAAIAAVAVAACVGVLAYGLRPAPAPAPPPAPAPTTLDRPIADFSLTERSGRAVTRADLLGKVWVVGFIFTRCVGPCPIVISSMARLQESLAEPGFSDARLLTITVDPEFDTREVLAGFATAVRAEPDRWWFLTGPKADVHALIEKSFLMAIQEVAEPGVPVGERIIHSTRLALVDRRGRVRRIVSGTEPAEVETVPGILRQLLSEAP
ncbi:MAG: SCO family protein [Planctomycetales bacterium]|nr:SCO family protein [Planctomycetales bacterium]